VNCELVVFVNFTVYEFVILRYFYTNMFIDHFHPYVDDGTGQQKLNLTNKTLGPPDARTLTALATKS
jgi:hypothetical protein